MKITIKIDKTQLGKIRSGVKEGKIILDKKTKAKRKRKKKVRLNLIFE